MKFSQYIQSALYQKTFTGKLVLKILSLWCFKGPNELLNSVLYLAYYKCIRFFKLHIYTWWILVCDYLCMGSIIYFGCYSSKTKDVTCKDPSYLYLCLSQSFFLSLPFFPLILYVLYPDNIIDVWQVGRVQKTLVWKLWRL